MLLCLSSHNKKGDNKNEKAFMRTKEYAWGQKKDYVGGATRILQFTF